MIKRTDLERKVTINVKQRFAAAGMRWESEFTINSFMELLCILHKKRVITEYKAALLNSIKPVI